MYDDVTVGEVMVEIITMVRSTPARLLSTRSLIGAERITPMVAALVKRMTNLANRCEAGEIGLDQVAEEIRRLVGH